MRIQFNKCVIIVAARAMLLLTMSEKATLIKCQDEHSTEEFLSSPLKGGSVVDFNPVCDAGLLWSISEMVIELNISYTQTLELLDSHHSKLQHIETFLDKKIKIVNPIRAEFISSTSPNKNNAKVTNIPVKNFTPSTVDMNLPNESNKIRGSQPPYDWQGLNSSLPATCEEAMRRAGPHAETDIYQIFLPNSGLKPFFVQCLLDEMGETPWLVIQRRITGDTKYDRDWWEYKTGFGNVAEEVWIGLERLHWLTVEQHMELWIHLMDWNNEVRYALYDGFGVGSEEQGYALNLLGKYEGNAGDSMRVHAGQKFSTKDVDNDNWANGSCAHRYLASWWFNNCHDCNLNGKRFRSQLDRERYGQAIDWKTWRGHQYGLQTVFMAIRPIQRNTLATNKKRIYKRIYFKEP